MGPVVRMLASVVLHSYISKLHRLISTYRRLGAPEAAWARAAALAAADAAVAAVAPS